MRRAGDQVQVGAVAFDRQLHHCVLGRPLMPLDRLVAGTQHVEHAAHVAIVHRQRELADRTAETAAVAQHDGLLGQRAALPCKRAGDGLGGRRVQVSRAWSGKTLREHRADRATVVREVLAEAGIEAPEIDRLAASTLAEDGLPRYVWDEIPVASTDYVQVVMASILQAQRWRREYEAAKSAAPSRASPTAA
jgi:hypothetical protein